MNCVTNITWRTASGARLGGFAYEYDAVGRIVLRSHAIGSTAFDRVYAYDDLDRLSSDGGVTYTYDAAGNRMTRTENGLTTTYTLGVGDRLASYGRAGTPRAPQEEFVPQFDDDMRPRQRRRVARRSEATEPRSGRKRSRNQTLIKTAIGIWSVTYNGENRPLRWVNGDTVLTMSFDRMGRRVTKNNQRFVYDGYLCIGKIEDSTSIHYSLSPIHCFVWDPTEPVATRPLVWQNGESVVLNFYFHDANKNVSEVVASNYEVTACYEYAPYGAVVIQCGEFAALNPLRHSSEFSEDGTATVYFNYRHYEPMTGRWLRRDPIDENGGLALYGYAYNRALNGIDRLGRNIWVESMTSVFGLHQRVCVDNWEESNQGKCRYKGKCYKKKGKYCISFGVNGGICWCSSSSSSSSSSSRSSGEDADYGSSEMPTGFKEDPTGWGIVYYDSAKGGNPDLTETVRGNCKFDIEMKEYMEGLVGKRSSYRPNHTCREFSAAVRDRAKEKKAGK